LLALYFTLLEKRGKKGSTGRGKGVKRGLTLGRSKSTGQMVEGGTSNCLVVRKWERKIGECRSAFCPKTGTKIGRKAAFRKEGRPGHQASYSKGGRRKTLNIEHWLQCSGDVRILRDESLSLEYSDKEEVIASDH